MALPAIFKKVSPIGSLIKTQRAKKPNARKDITKRTYRKKENKKD